MKSTDAEDNIIRKQIFQSFKAHAERKDPGLQATLIDHLKTVAHLEGQFKFQRNTDRSIYLSIFLNHSFQHALECSISRILKFLVFSVFHEFLFLSTN